MIPAFPMDGGRVLRALLATALGYAPATRLAAAIGQGLAVVMALAGLFISPMLVLVALFVWIGAAGELYDTERRTLLAGVPVSAAALKRFLVLSPDDTPDVAAAAAISGSQHDFPVTVAGRPDQQVIGVLGHCELLSMLARRGTTVGDAMHRTFSAITETDSLAKAIEQMQSDRCSALPVMRDDRLVGLLTSASVAEFLALRAAGANLQSA
jgi:CBS domain-containing protein